MYIQRNKMTANEFVNTIQLFPIIVLFKFSVICVCDNLNRQIRVLATANPY